MEHQIFFDIVVVLFLSVAVLLLCHRIHLPPIVGFLITGIVAGPDGLAFVSTSKNVEMLAEIGVILLLFSIGMHFSIRKLFDLKRFFFIGGPLQVLLTSLAGFIVGYLVGRPLGESIFLGWLLSLSSTAIVLTILEKRRELSTPQGNVTTSILIFQDVIAVLMILSTTFLAGEKPLTFSPSIFGELGKGLLLLLGVFLASEKVVPWVLFHVARTQIRELFLFTVLALCFAVAWVTSAMGLSLSIGAFLAGLTVSETEYSNEAIGDIRPFQALFTSFFFISIGMLLQIDFVFKEPVTILMITVGVLVLKSFVAAITTLIVGLPIRIATMVGLFLAQIGEFSFVLIQEGVREGIGTDYHYQLFLAVALLTMLVTPFFIALAPRFGVWVATWNWPEPLKSGMTLKIPAEAAFPEKGHVIIVGFSLAGQYLARACRLAGEPYAILEMDPHIIRQEKGKGEPIFFGDATHENVLRSLNVEEAGVLAILINDMHTTQRIIRIARHTNPRLYILVKMRSMRKAKAVLDLGADDVIPDEFGSSVEIFTRVMKRCHMPDEEIYAFIDEIRTEGYETLRPMPQRKRAIDWDEISPDLEVTSHRIRDSSSLAGKTIGEASLRQRFGIHVLLIKRGREKFTEITPEMRIEKSDVLIVVGLKANTPRFAQEAHGTES